MEFSTKSIRKNLGAKIRKVRLANQGGAAAGFSCRHTPRYQIFRKLANNLGHLVQL